MRKTVMSLLLVCVLLLGLLPALSPAAQADHVCFVAVNDILLDLDSAPYLMGSTYYIPYWIFSNFRIYYNSFGGTGTVSLYTQERQIFFDLSAGVAYDSDNVIYSAQAVYSGGQVYVPAYFLCQYFGLNCHFIAGSGYGDILRITDGSEVLSNSIFLAAAKTMMQSRYDAYLAAQTPQEAPEITPAPQIPSPEVEESPEPDRDRSDTSVYLSFYGLPTEGMLHTLESAGDVRACFFAAPSELRERPDMLRRVLGLGHNVGILCGENAQEDHDLASALLSEAAMFKSLLTAARPGSEESVRALADARGLVYWERGIGIGNDGQNVPRAEDITSIAEVSVQRVDVTLLSGETTERILPAILQYLTENKFGLCAPSEINSVDK